ncbi:ERF family protein [Listeria booriae]|uniref:ERF family protein n=1 Tax=Listeria booriae TaxID=1552123 RepID=A0A842EX77_9LIST|nr:ERF family protein [Listeria booriae]MBC2239795.1 ERF family protein [Listeria booriae]
MTDKKLSLYQKMSKVMESIEHLQKDDQVSFKTTNYKAISEEKVTKSVRKALIEQGLVIFPTEQEMTREGTLTSVNTKYKIVDIDSGDFEILASSGQGADTQDKGSGKAMTYAFKYLLLRTFAIPTGEDPDKTSSPEQDEKELASMRKTLNGLVKECVDKSGGEISAIKEWLVKKAGAESYEAANKEELKNMGIFADGLIAKAEKEQNKNDE